MFRKILMIILFSMSYNHALAECLEEEVEIDELCVDRDKVHYIQSSHRLQALIEEANEGEYIFLKSGTYEIDSSQETGLLITHKKSLTLLGEENTIVTTKRGEMPVLTIASAQNITIENIIFTHDIKGRCESPVIKLTQAKYVKILETTAGAGIQAITIDHSQNVEIIGGKAIKNTEGVFAIRDSKEITIRNMGIEGNDNLGRVKQGILEIANSDGILFSYNVIKDNKNAYFKNVVHSKNLEIEGNEFRDNGFSNYDISETSPSEAKPNKVLWSKNVMIHPQLSEFRFEFVGTLKDKSANINLINIYQFVSQQEQLLQTIEGLDIDTLADEKGNSFRIEDANFDGYQDILLMSSVKAEEPIYRFWFFNAAEKIFIQDNELKDISAPVIDSAKKQISSSWKSSAVNFGSNYYEFVNGKATLVRQELKDFSATGAYQLTIKERKENKMKIVEQRWVKEPSGVKEEAAPDLIRRVWQQLDKIINNPQACTHETNEVRWLYCHLQEVINYSSLQKLAQLPAFMQGPHKDTQLNLEVNHDFGYYNKEFVIWLKETLVPASQDSSFKKLTEPMYQRYFQKLARTFYAVSLQLRENPIDFEKAKQCYLTHIKNQTPCCYTSWFQNDLLGDYAPQTVKTALAFWIRRTIDGTDQEWREGLRFLLETYDPDFLRTMEEKNLLRYQTLRHQIARIAPHYCQSHPIVVLSSSRIFHFSTLKMALQQANAGDIIWLCPGTYSEPLHLEGLSHLSIYGDHANFWIPFSSDPPLTIKGAQYIEIAGLNFSLERLQANSKCLNITDSHHIYLRDNTIENCGTYGIWLSQVHDAELTGNQLYHCQEGLTVQNSSHLLLKQNRFVGNLQKNISIPKAQVFTNRWLNENEIYATLEEQNDWFKFTDLKAQASQGNPVSQLLLSFYWDHEDDAESFKWLSQAATQGYAKAQYHLGWKCHEGREQGQALYWFQQAAKQGYLKAQILLARWYLEGNSVPQDFTQAVFWARKAAQQGDAQAQNILAGLYYEGKGVPQEVNLAAYWVGQAAQQGYSQAQYNLGQLYYQGLGVSQDFKQASDWFKQAAQQGHREAQNHLNWMNSMVH